VRYCATSHSGKFGGGWRSLETIGRSIPIAEIVTRLARAGKTNSSGADGRGPRSTVSTDAEGVGKGDADDADADAGLAAGDGDNSCGVAEGVHAPNASAAAISNPQLNRHFVMETTKARSRPEGRRADRRHSFLGRSST